MQTVNVKTKTKQIINNNDTNDNDSLFERKIQNTTEGLSHDCFNWLEKVAGNNKDNVIVIAKYIMSMKTETNLSNNYRRSIIILLSKFFDIFQESKDIQIHDQREHLFI